MNVGRVGFDEREGVGQAWRGEGCGGGSDSAALGGGASGLGGSAGQAPSAELPGAGRGGFGFEAPGEAAEQRDCAGGPQADHGLGSRAPCGLRPDVRSGEAGGGSRLFPVGGNAAQVDG